MTRSQLAGFCTLLVVAVGLALAAGACGVEALDLSGHACPCGPGFECDTTRNVCVPPSDLVDASVPEAAPEACQGDNCACTTATDCKDNLGFPACEGTKCVQCSSSGPDTCPQLSYCLANQCATGCKTDAECAAVSAFAPFCNTQRHQCVVCKTDAECTGGLKCSPAGACVSACTGTCANGDMCCNGLCLDTKTDPLNCQGCGVVCGGTSPACCASGCVDLLTSKTDCGKCGTACSTANAATTSCQAGTCRPTCNQGFSHCATGQNTGCETNTSNTTDQCGSCTRNCNTSVVHANGVACVASACTYATCGGGFADCDMVKGNGCECPAGLTCGARGLLCCAGNTCPTSGVCEPAPADDGRCH